MKHFFSDPKVMAASGLMAMLLKGIIYSLIAAIINFADKTQHFDLNFVFVIAYPWIGISADLLLYALKDKIWAFLPDSASIPKNWGMTADQVLEFAKSLPKIRLMRWTGASMLTNIMFSHEPPPLFGSYESLLLKTLVWFGFWFFICALFDPLWSKFFKVKRPSLIMQYICMPYSVTRLAHEFI